MAGKLRCDIEAGVIAASMSCRILNQGRHVSSGEEVEVDCGMIVVCMPSNARTRTKDS
jgi:hypothetical protein